MKLRSLAILAAAVAIPAVSFVALPNAAEARGRGNRSEMVAQRGVAQQVIAQRGDRGNLTPEEREAKQAERQAKMQEALGLSDSQVAQMQAIRDNYRPQMEALRTESQALREGGASREEVKAALGDRKQALRDSMKSEIQAILTPEQIEKMEALKPGRGGRRGGRGAGSAS